MTTGLDGTIQKGVGAGFAITGSTDLEFYADVVSTITMPFKTTRPAESK